MDEKIKQTLASLKNNPGAVQSLFETQDGQNLLRMLAGQDQGKTLQQAAQNAAAGNTAQMVRMISQLMQNPEGAELVRRINDSLQK